MKCNWAAIKSHVLYALLLLLLSTTVKSQELEPRLFTNLPRDMNFLVFGYGYSYGNTLLDPAVPIEDLNGNIHAAVAAYARSINFFGMSGKVDVIVPFAAGNWAGYYTGIDTTTERTGLGDPRFRLSFNFLGSPSLSREDFATYKQDVNAGFSIQFIAPLGQYFPERLINLGSNRWTVIPQLGFSKSMGQWTVEGYSGVWIFTRNDAFFNGNIRDQRPMGTIKTHLIRSFRNNMWATIGIGYALGGTAVINNVETDSRISTMRIGLTVAIPINVHTIRFNAAQAVRFEQGPEFTAFGFSYQYRWIGK